MPSIGSSTATAWPCSASKARRGGSRTAPTVEMTTGATIAGRPRVPYSVGALWSSPGAARKKARQDHQQTGHSRKYKVIAKYGAYHGGTTGALSAGGGWERKSV